MPTREEIMQMKAVMRDAGMRWADMNNESWGPGQAALYKKYLSGLLKTPVSRTRTAATPITAVPAVGGAMITPAVAAGIVANPAARDELTGGPATLGYTLYSINDWGRENITPVLHLAVNTIASGALSAWDWLTGLGRMFDDSSTPSTPSGGTTAPAPSNPPANPTPSQPALPAQTLPATAQPTSGGVAAGGATGGTPNPNDDKKKKYDWSLWKPYQGYGRGNWLSKGVKGVRDYSITLGTAAAVNELAPFLYEVPYRYVTLEPLPHKTILLYFGATPVKSEEQKKSEEKSKEDGQKVTWENL